MPFLLSYGRKTIQERFAAQPIIDDTAPPPVTTTSTSKTKPPPITTSPLTTTNSYIKRQVRIVEDPVPVNHHHNHQVNSNVPINTSNNVQSNNNVRSSNNNSRNRSDTKSNNNNRDNNDIVGVESLLELLSESTSSSSEQESSPVNRSWLISGGVNQSNSGSRNSIVTDHNTTSTSSTIESDLESQSNKQPKQQQAPKPNRQQQQLPPRPPSSTALPSSSISRQLQQQHRHQQQRKDLNIDNNSATSEEGNITAGSETTITTTTTIQQDISNKQNQLIVLNINTTDMSLQQNPQQQQQQQKQQQQNPSNAPPHPLWSSSATSSVISDEYNDTPERLHQEQKRLRKIQRPWNTINGNKEQQQSQHQQQVNDTYRIPLKPPSFPQQQQRHGQHQQQTQQQQGQQQGQQHGHQQQQRQQQQGQQYNNDGQENLYGDNSNNNNNEPVGSYDSSYTQQQQHNFPIYEIQRMKNKARRLKQRREGSSISSDQQQQQQQQDDNNNDESIQEIHRQYIQYQREQSLYHKEIQQQEEQYRKQKFHKTRIQFENRFNHTNNTDESTDGVGIVTPSNHSTSTAGGGGFSVGRSARQRRTLSWSSGGGGKNGGGDGSSSGGVGAPVMIPHSHSYNTTSTSSPSQFGRIGTDHNHNRKQQHSINNNSKYDNNNNNDNIPKSASSDTWNIHQHQQHNIRSTITTPIDKEQEDNNSNLWFSEAQTFSMNNLQKDNIFKKNSLLSKKSKQDNQHDNDNDDGSGDVVNDDVVDEDEMIDYRLHDLCGEASSIDDIAWRNALFLVTIQPELAKIVTTSEDEDDNDDGGGKWTPLHISVMDPSSPPPLYIIYALLYANNVALSYRDDGGRLPIHLLAASSANITIMNLFIQIYPKSLYEIDYVGFTPLHLLLLNYNSTHRHSSVVQVSSNRNRLPLSVTATLLEQIKILLGYTINRNTVVDSNHGRQGISSSNVVLQRRREHMNVPVNQLYSTSTTMMKQNGDGFRSNSMQSNFVTTKFNRDILFDKEPEEWKTFPQDVQTSLRKLADWRYTQKKKGSSRQQKRTGRSGHPSSSLLAFDDDDEYFGEEPEEAIEVELYHTDNRENASSMVRRNSVNQTNPAAIPTPGTRQLPIHMLLERMMQQQHQRQGKKAVPINSHISKSGSSEEVASTNNMITKNKSKSHSGSMRSLFCCQLNKIDTKKRNHDDDAKMDITDDKDDEYDERSTDDLENAISCSSATQESISPTNSWISIIRLLVTAYPEALIVRDGNDLTPLLQVLLSQNMENRSKTSNVTSNNTTTKHYVASPNLEIIELLLGKRTGDCSIPSWARDIPIHQHCTTNDNSIQINPAMIPYPLGNQLPLHIAVEECMSLNDDDTYYEIIKTIYEAYPAALTIQDWKGRTPLHIALNTFQKHMKYPPDPRVLALLMKDERVVQMIDDYGSVPFDVLLDNAHFIPKVKPKIGQMNFHSNERGMNLEDRQKIESDLMDASTVYQRFFYSSLSLLGSIRPRNSTSFERSSSRVLLRRLRVLPSWLRSEACTSNYIRELLIEELAKPWPTALVLFDGLLLLTLIVVFRLQIDHLIDRLEMTNTDGNFPTWYTFIVYTTAALRLVYHLIYSIYSSTMRQFRYLYLCNMWFWLDVSTMILTCATSIFVYDDTQSVQSLLQLGSTCTGMLWLCAIGYLRNWWYSMAVFVGGFTTIAIRLLAPSIASMIFIIAFAQVYYTRFQFDCTLYNQADGITIYNNDEFRMVDEAPPVCTVHDSYRIVYALLRGDTSVFLNGVDNTADDNNPFIQSNSVITAFMLLFAVIVLVAVIVTIIMAAVALNFDAIGRICFWEPKLAFVLATIPDESDHENEKRRMKENDLPCVTAMLEEWWDSLLIVLSGDESRTRKSWYLRTSQTFQKRNEKSKYSMGKILWFLISIIFIPVWLVFGLFTLGLLWPPQVRRYLFRPFRTIVDCQYHRPDASNGTNQFDVSATSKLHDEIYQLKLMSLDRSDQVERELRELTELLYLAMRDDS